MILVDTSIWIDHFRRGDAVLQAWLDREQVLGHPMVVGELALGAPQWQGAMTADLDVLPQAVVASDQEVLALIEHGRLFGSGIGYVAAHLLAAVRMTPGAGLWSRDRKLAAVAERLSLAARPHDA